jgi:hypothetical protein
VQRQSDLETLDIGIVPASASPVPDAGGYANAAAQHAFCANTKCWISIIYDQAPKKVTSSRRPAADSGRACSSGGSSTALSLPVRQIDAHPPLDGNAVLQVRSRRQSTEANHSVSRTVHLRTGARK